MISVIQRVTRAEVQVDTTCIGKIDCGLLALVAVEKHDTEQQAQRLAQRLLGYRLFSDEEDRMNLTVRDIEGALLIVPQFTLAADTAKGARPSFTAAAPPDHGKRLFDRLVQHVKQDYPRVKCGRFGANMQVALVNNGPVTFILRAPPPAR